MTVVTFGKTAVHAHIRIKISVLLKMNRNIAEQSSEDRPLVHISEKTI